MVDGSSLLSTSFYGTAQPLLFAKTEEEKIKAYEKLMKSPDGKYTNGIYVFFKTLFNIIDTHKYTHVAITLDRSRKSTFRRQMYSDYKANRKSTPSPLSEQFKTLTEILEYINIPVFSHEEYEADDFAGSISKRFETMLPTYLMSKDADYLQLVSNHTKLLMPTKKAEEMYLELGFNKDEIANFNIPKGMFEFTPLYVKHFYGVEPIQIIDLKALEGDKSDNIPGTKGVGPKASVPLIKEYFSIENLYDDIENLSDIEIKEKSKFFKDSLGINKSPIKSLLADKDNAFLSKKLATIKTDIPEIQDLDLEDLRYNIDKKKANEAFSKLGMKSLLFKI